MENDERAVARNLSFIQRLEERNRLKKLSSVKSKEELELEEKERGFSTHFRGANASASDKVGSASKRFSVLSGSSPSVSGKMSALSRLAAAAFGSSTAAPSPSVSLLEAPSTVSHKKVWETSAAQSTSSSADDRDADGFANAVEGSHQPTADSLDGQSSIEDYLLSSPLRRGTRRKSGADSDAATESTHRLSITEILRMSSPSKTPRVSLSDEELAEEKVGVGAVLMQRIAGMDLGQQASLLKLLDATRAVNTKPTSPVPMIRVSSPAANRNDREERGGENVSPSSVSALSIDGRITIRIRIYTSWGTEKHVSLAGIRLQLDESTYIDVLKYFHVQILSGLQALPGTTDAVRKMNLLFASSIGSSLSWKGPVQEGAPLEIRLQDIPESNFVESFGGKELIASSLKLALWNAEGAIGDVVGLPPRNAAKELDVYANGKCVWSGQLPLLEGGKLRRLGREIVSPSQLIPVFAAVLSKSPAAARSIESSKDLSRPTSSSAAPIWLDGLKPSVQSQQFEQLTPRQSARPASGRRSLQIQSGADDRSPSNPAINHKSEPIHQVERSSEKKRRSRRRDLVAEKSPEERLNDAITRPSTDSAGDEVLRRSINAITLADRSNRGRIGQGAALSCDDTVVADNLEASIDSLTDLKVPTLSENGLLISHSRSGSRFASSTPIDSSIAAPQPSSKSSRNKRIDEVQHVVQSTLAGLADIMSDIQQSRRSPAASNTAVQNLASMQQVSPIQQQLQLGAESPQVDEMEDSGRYFSLPFLPKGRVLTFEILSTWGDSHYVGLNGIDIFDSAGAIITPRKERRLDGDSVFIESVEGNPKDINILPEYGQDPRTATNLVDGVNFTRDDLHVWLAPLGYYDQARRQTSRLSSVEDQSSPVASVTITFTTDVSLSMIRIFNYNKSRTYSYRGVRCCRILFDDRVIFKGELRIAPGLLTSADAASEVILFTTDDRILQNVAKYDEKAGYYTDDSTSKWVEKLMDKHFQRRPSTAEGKRTPLRSSMGNSTQLLTRHVRVSAALFPNSSPGIDLQSELRPKTTASVVIPQMVSKATPPPLAPPFDLSVEDTDDDAAFLAELRDTFPSSSPPAPPSPTFRKSPITAQPLQPTAATIVSADLVNCCAIKLIIESSWGDTNFVGLAGINVLVTTKCVPLALDSRRITAEPRDLSTLGRCDDPRTPEKLLDGMNDTTDDTHMWLIPFTKGSNHSIQFEWSGTEQVAGIRVWNYNKPGDDVRGVKVVTIVAFNQNGQASRIGRCIFRPAPGCDGVTFGQTIYFRDVIKRNMDDVMGGSPAAAGTVTKYLAPPLRQDYEVPYLPSGQLWKFTFFENFGDGYYLGLDGIEMFDSASNRISLDEIGATVTAVPHSLQDINTDDPRTPENLFFPAAPGHHPGQEQHVPWLAPISRCMTTQEKATAARRIQRQHGRASSSGQLQQDFDFLPDNALFVLFQEPVTLSLIRLYNYSKTPTRGIKDLAIHVDGKLIFMGKLLSAER